MKGFIIFFVVVIAALLGAVIVQDGVPVAPTDFVARGAPTGEIKTRSYERTVHRVLIQRETYEAWLYMPLATSHKPPVIIMAPGMAAQKDFGFMSSYATRFVEQGWAVFVFDYRAFGNSDGTPRNLVDPTYHVQDYHAAIVHLVNTNLSNVVDVSRIGLWGTSFSGGHVLVTAAEFERVVKAYPLNYVLNQRPEALNITLPRLKAVLAQVPHLDPNAVIPTLDLALMARGFALAVADWLGSWFGLSVYIKLYGSPNEVAILNTQEAMDYGKLIPENPAGGWVNKVPARAVLYITRYKPLNEVPGITTPTLIIAATKDTLCPISAVNEAEKVLKNGKVLKYDAGHFELYEGNPLFQEVVTQQIRFFRENL